MCHCRRVCAVVAAAFLRVLRTLFSAEIANVPGLANVDHVDAVWASLPEVWLHVHLHVLGTDVALGRQEHLDVLGSGIEARGEVVGSHDRGC